MISIYKSIRYTAFATLLGLWLAAAACWQKDPSAAASGRNRGEKKRAALPKPQEAKPAKELQPTGGKPADIPKTLFAYEGFSADARLDQLPRQEALKLCRQDLSTRKKQADKHHAAGLGCKLAANTFGRSRAGCREFFETCMSRHPAKPVIHDFCQDLDWSECRITVAELGACRRAEQRGLHELLEKLDCDYEGPRLTAAPELPECEVAKERCSALFGYLRKPAFPEKSPGQKGGR